MNSDERILQILENSACLSKGQMLGYIRNNLYPEELRAVELHLSGCIFCNDALEGMEQEKDVEKLLQSLTPPLLPAITVKEKPKEKKEVAPTSKAEKIPAVTKSGNHNVPLSAEETRSKTSAQLPVKSKNIFRPLGIAAAVLIGFGILWYVEFRPQEQELLSQKMETDKDSLAPLAADTKSAAKGNTDSLLAKEAKAHKDLLAMQAKVHKDSLTLAKNMEAKSKIKTQDTGKQVLASARNAEIQAEKQPVAMMAKTAAGREEEKSADKKVAEESADAVARSANKTKEDNSPKDGVSDFDTGLKLYKQKQYASALLYFRPAESDKSDPRHWDAVYYSALCNKNLNKSRRAKKLFERVVEGNAPQKKAAQKQLDDMKNAEN